MPGPVGSVIVAFDSVPELATLASAPGIREVLALDREADGSDEQLANPAVMQTMLTTFETTFRCRCRRAEEPIAPECPDMERDVKCAGYVDVVVFGLARVVGCARGLWAPSRTGSRLMAPTSRSPTPEIDTNPSDIAAAQARARSVRHVIERACVTVMDDLAVGAGPEPLAYDADILQRTQQLQLYIRQCHGERDLAPLGKFVMDKTDRSR